MILSLHVFFKTSKILIFSVKTYDYTISIVEFTSRCKQTGPSVGQPGIIICIKDIYYSGKAQANSYLAVLKSSAKILTVSFAANSGFRAVSEMPDTTLE